MPKGTMAAPWDCIGTSPPLVESESQWTPSSCKAYASQFRSLPIRLLDSQSVFHGDLQPCTTVRTNTLLSMKLPYSTNKVTFHITFADSEELMYVRSISERP